MKIKEKRNTLSDDLEKEIKKRCVLSLTEVGEVFRQTVANFGSSDRKIAIANGDRPMRGTASSKVDADL
jgi:putative transposon-encoded protein